MTIMESIEKRLGLILIGLFAVPLLSIFCLLLSPLTIGMAIFSSNQKLTEMFEKSDDSNVQTPEGK